MKYNFEALRKVCHRTKFNGLIYISEKGKPLFDFCQGYANMNDEISINSDTLFGIASGTKLITALSIGLLIKRGALDFQTKTTDVLNLHKGYDSDITIQDLLSHRSGMPDYYDEDLIDDNFQLSVPIYNLHTPKDYLPLFPERLMDFSPNSNFKYNNGGYVYLAMIIEAVSHRSYKTFVEEELFRPIGIERSGVYPTNKLPSNTAIGYMPEGSDWVSNIYKLPIQAGGDGGIYMTCTDFNLLWKAFISGTLLGEAMTQRFLAPISCVYPDKDIYYGLGVWLKKIKDEFIPYVIGSDSGVSFKSAYRINKDQYFFAVSNTSNHLWQIIGELNKLIET